MLPVVARARAENLSAATPAPAAPRAEFAYEALAALAAETPCGRTPYGERIRVPIAGGWFRGPAIAG